MSLPLQGHVLDELFHEGRYLYPTDVVEVVERHHPHDGPGVSRDVIAAYADEVLGALGPRAPFTPDRFRSLLEGRVTDAAIWFPNAVYEVAPGRLSVYPQRWHERLTGERDAVGYVTLIAEDLAVARGVDAVGAPPPVPRSLLLDAMTVLGRLDRPTAARLVTDARLAGRIRVDPFQNPDADVRIVAQPPRGSPSPEPVPAGNRPPVGTP